MKKDAMTAVEPNEGDTIKVFDLDERQVGREGGSKFKRKSYIQAPLSVSIDQSLYIIEPGITIYECNEETIAVQGDHHLQINNGARNCISWFLRSSQDLKR